MTEIHVHRNPEYTKWRHERLQSLSFETARAAFTDYFKHPLANPSLAAESGVLRPPMLDELLAIPSRGGVLPFHYVSDIPYIEDEQPGYEGSPYYEIKEFLDLVQPKPGDVVYDLGSGYGRVVFMGALIYPDVTWKGIEFVDERVNSANEVKDKLGLINAQFMQGNVRDMDFSDGDIFYMFNPFSEETLEVVMDKLHKIARLKRIIIAANGIRLLEKPFWVSELFPNRESDIKFFESLK
jgi:SAM-dependent methyltransferase